MRIGLIHPFPCDEVRRGGERYLGDLAWYLAGAGHDVEILTTAATRSVRSEGGVTTRSSRRIEHRRLAARGLGPVQTHALSCLPSLLRRRFDVVHALTPWGALAAVLAGQRVVYTELGHPTPEELDRTPGGLRLYRSALRRAAAVTALSRSAAEAVAATGGVAPTVVPPGVRTDRFGPGTSRADPPVVLFVSDAGAWRKGVDVAIAAVGSLLDDRPGLRLQLVGPGDHRWALERLRLADDAPAVRAIEIIDVRDPAELAARYSSASVTVLPSTHEAFGLAVVESLASGTPVVCTAGWGMDDIVTEPAVGRRFRAGDHLDCASAIDAVLGSADDPATRRACRDHARRWDWATAVGPAHESVYLGVLRGGRSSHTAVPGAGV